MNLLQQKSSLETREGQCAWECSAVRTLCSTDTLATQKASTLEKPLPLHLLFLTDRRQAPVAAVLPVSLSEAVVKAAIASFPSSSAGGPDAGGPQHLQELIANADENSQILTSITCSINVLLTGNIPASIRPYLLRGTITALNKKGD